jgi:glycerophosphoryl diester phosphodiesterase
MKKIHFLLIAILMLNCTSTQKAAKSTTHFYDNPVIAHRGAWKKNNLPENSIASLKHAIELKCAGSEFDVRMTADDSLVVNHDPHFNTLEIEKSKYADLLAFNLSNGEKIPTLKEYILAGMGHNTATRLVCEIKPSEISKERGISITAKTVYLIQQLNAQEMVVFISFDYDILKKIKELNPKASTQYLEDNKPFEQLKKDGISGADYYFTSFKDHPEWIKTAKKNNLTLNAWTVNNAADMDWLIINKFDYITTNEPELLFQRLKINK